VGEPGPGPADSAALPGFTALPDLASRQLGGSVVAASDEFFAEKENLILPGPAVFTAGTFGHKGKIYDGWETRRRREHGHDHAIVRLGATGIVHGAIVDTAHFRGNYPPEISVEAVFASGYPSPAELAGLPWRTLVGRTGARGDSQNGYAVDDRHCWTHIRLSIYPDGGVARFRVHGEVLPDPAFLTGTIDLAAMENGGRVVGCSDAFYSPPANLLLPGRARVMGRAGRTRGGAAPVPTSWSSRAPRCRRHRGNPRQAAAELLASTARRRPARPASGTPASGKAAATGSRSCRRWRRSTAWAGSRSASRACRPPARRPAWSRS